MNDGIKNTSTIALINLRKLHILLCFVYTDQERAMSDVLKARKRNKPKYVPRFLGSAVVVEFPGNLYSKILDTSKDNKVNCNNLAKYAVIIQF